MWSFFSSRRDVEKDIEELIAKLEVQAILVDLSKKAEVIKAAKELRDILQSNPKINPIHRRRVLNIIDLVKVNALRAKGEEAYDLFRDLDSISSQLREVK